MRKIFLLVFWLIAGTGFGQEMNIKVLPQEGIFLNKSWLFRSGDSLSWAGLDIADRHWQKINPQLWLDSIGKTFDKQGWFRLHLNIDTTITHQALALQLWQRGASEIYLNGRLIYRFGKVSADTQKEEKYSPFGEPVHIVFTQSKNILAVRYSDSNAHQLYESFGRYARTAGFRLKISPLNVAIHNFGAEIRKSTGFNLGVGGILFAMALLHFLIFLFYKKQKTSLYYSIFSFVLSIRYFLDYLHYQEHNIDRVIYYNITGFSLVVSAFVAILALLYQIFFRRIPKYFWLFPILGILVFVLFFLNVPYSDLMLPVFSVVAFVEALRVSISAFSKRKGDTWVAGAGFTTAVLMIFMLSAAIRTFGLQFLIPLHLNMIIDIVGVLGVTLLMSVFLAREISMTNYELEKQVIQIKELSEKSIAQERINQQILASQNQILEEQVKERTSEIQEKSIELSIQNEEIAAQRDSLKEKSQALENAYTHITDSVRYAERIQKALLGNPDSILSLFEEAFILFKPKNIVSGDFYWFAQLQIPHPESEDIISLKVVIAADCTGHGVPGAFMTVMGNNFLNDIIYNRGIIQPHEILYALDEQIRGVFRSRHQSQESNIQDGMDIAVVVLNTDSGIVSFAGAKNPMFLARNNKITEIKASRFPIGSEQYRTPKVFEPVVLELQTGDAIYIFSDGFTDQFGLKTKRRYMKKRFRAFLEGISHLNMFQQKQLLEEELEEWSPAYLNQQTDDILVMGIRIIVPQAEFDEPIGFKIESNN